MSARKDWYYRHPVIQQVRRMNVVHCEFVRAKRNINNLPHAWNDKHSDKKYSKCWKDRYKCRSQWMREGKRRYSEWDSPRELAERLQGLTGLSYDECWDAVENTARTNTSWDGSETAEWYDYEDAVEYIKERYNLLLTILYG